MTTFDIDAQDLVLSNTPTYEDEVLTYEHRSHGGELLPSVPSADSEMTISFRGSYRVRDMNNRANLLLKHMCQDLIAAMHVREGGRDDR